MGEYLENIGDNNMDMKNIQFNKRHNLHATANTVDLFLCCKFCAGCALYKMCTANTQNKSVSRSFSMFHSVAAMQYNVQAYWFMSPVCLQAHHIWFAIPSLA